MENSSLLLSPTSMGEELGFVKCATTILLQDMKKIMNGCSQKMNSLLSSTI